jgi:ubiquinone/menaquinone biosynthesis C-methylase UbiE
MLPDPPRHNSRANRAHFDQLAAKWDSLPSVPGEAETVRRFVAAARPGAFVLDLGCGTGILAGPLLETAARRVVEADVSERMLAENARKRQDARLVRVCSDALLLPFADATFDTILCFGVLPHLGEPGLALPCVLRCVRPGGALAIGHAMSSEELNVFHGSLEGPVRKDRLMPAAELAALLSRMGAAPVSAEEAPGWYFVAARRNLSCG